MHFSIKSLALITTLLLSSCSQWNTAVPDQEVITNISSIYGNIMVPSNWKYYECPKRDYCGTLSFPFPPESNGPLEIQEGNVYGGYSKNDIYFIVAETNNKFSLEESAECMDNDQLDQKNLYCPRKKQFILNLPFYSILKFTAETQKDDINNMDIAVYLVKIKNHEFFIRSHAKTLEDKKLLDITMLNLKIGDESTDSSSK